MTLALVFLCAAVPLASAAVGRHEAVIAAAGDIVCNPATPTSATTCQHSATGALVTAANADRVLALGDLQYSDGALASFLGAYDPVWGAFKATTLPVPGNHEYGTAGAAGYFDYWGAQAGERTQGWYATRIGSWLVLSLNSNCSSIGGCGRDSAQGVWLESQLRSSTATCQLAYWHHPRFSSGLHGDSEAVQPLWGILQEYQAELVLAGHDHGFERFEPMLDDGTLSSAGIASYVIGTGGVDLRDFSAARPGSAVRIKRFGIGVIDLYANGWAAEFRATDGTTSSDGVVHECSPSAAAVAPAAAAAPAPVAAAKSGQSAARVRAVRIGGSRVLPARSQQGLVLWWRSTTPAVCSVRRAVSQAGGVRHVVTRVRGKQTGRCRLRAVNAGDAFYAAASISIGFRVR